jgi:hypothetical protein
LPAVSTQHLGSYRAASAADLPEVDPAAADSGVGSIPLISARGKNDGAALASQRIPSPRSRVGSLPIKLTLAGLQAEQEMLRRRIATFGHAEDPMDIWAELGVARPETVPMLEAAAFTALAERLRIVSKA